MSRPRPWPLCCDKCQKTYVKLWDCSKCSNASGGYCWNCIRKHVKEPHDD